ncbi:MAG: hypothetical protein IJS09_06135 [Treponema sp.]|nr:hypothetical protein [Treponema sp.]
MTVLEFSEKFDVLNKKEFEKAQLLCYFLYKEKGISIFNSKTIEHLFLDFGFSQPNYARLKTKLLGEKIFTTSNSDKTSLEFVRKNLELLEREYGNLWKNTKVLISDSEYLPEEKFCNKRSYLTTLVKEINCSYKNACYDACFVLMRRLFEIMLIHAYEKLSIQDAIKKDGNYIMLEGIVSDAKANDTLALSRNTRADLDKFRELGNYSAHSITFLASVKDIDDIQLHYRAMLEELYTKAGIV